jgi:hypothetical protein
MRRDDGVTMHDTVRWSWIPAGSTVSGVVCGTVGSTEQFSAHTRNIPADSKSHVKFKTRQEKLARNLG